jgi:molecular chaperone DnaK (HSP70)
MVYAIDFGTSNTVVSRWNQATQQAETINLVDLSMQLAPNPPLVPSLLYLEGLDQVIVGQQVRDRGLDLESDRRFFRNFKRGIGTNFQGFLPELDGQPLSFEQIGSRFLTTVIAQLQQNDPNVDSLVFTVPVDSFEAYRNWLTQVCKSLSIEQVRLLDEPTAAALGYGLTAEEGGCLLVIDFGGGTLDLSLVQLEKGASASASVGFLLKWGQRVLEESGQRPKLARVIAKAGQNLGGADLDNWLVDHFVNEQGITMSPLTLRLAERLKIQLSTITETTEAYFDDETLDSFELSLNRDRFHHILQANGFFERLDESMTQVLQQARRQGIEPTDVNAVLLVGGTAQIPVVRTWIERYFPASKIRADRPFEAIAQGALQINRGIEVRDFLYHSYGVRYWNRRDNCHAWHPIVNQGQAYPMDKPIELVLGASIDNQPSIELIIGELGQVSQSTEVFFEGDRLVTRLVTSGQATVKPLNDREGAKTIAQLDPPGFPGSDRIKVLFRVDGDRILRITIEDLLTLRTLAADIAVVEL